MQISMRCVHKWSPQYSRCRVKSIVRMTDSLLRLTRTDVDIGAEITSYTLLGVPCYKYSIVGPKTLFYLLY